MTRRCRPRAFTLIELLVVMGVIALLIGLSMPALSHARRSAQATRCAAHLKNIGTAWAIYADRHPQALPLAVSMPQPIGTAPDELTIMNVLSREISGTDVYACPADDRGYFLQTGTSYEYLPGLVIDLDNSNAAKLAAAARQRPDLVPILADAAEFHTAPPGTTPRQTVYHDAHVDWLFESIPTEYQSAP